MPASAVLQDGSSCMALPSRRSTIGEHVIATTLSLLHKLHIVEFRTRTDKEWFRTEAAWGSYIREVSRRPTSFCARMVWPSPSE